MNKNYNKLLAVVLALALMLGVGRTALAATVEGVEDPRISVTVNGAEVEVRCCIGRQLEDDQIHVRSAELVPSRLGQLLGGDQTAVHRLYRAGEHLLKVLILSLELRDQRGELGQIRPKAMENTPILAFVLTNMV